MSRTPVANPFVPGSDAVPQVWAGRAGELADFAVARSRRLAGVYERGRIMLGPPGIGKSVLLNRIAQDGAALGDIVLPPIRLSTGTAPVEALVNAVTRVIESSSVGEQVAASLLQALSRFSEIRTPAGAVKLVLPDSAASDLATVLVELGRIAAVREVAAVIRIDEVQAPDDRTQMSALLVALADALAETVESRDAAGNVHEQVLPIIVYLSGLPSFWDRAEAAKATFARRLAPMRLSPLADADLRQALHPFTSEGWPVLGDAGEARVWMDAAAVDGIISRALGDPFLFQLLGRAAWDAGEAETITGADVEAGWSEVRDEAERHVARLLGGLADQERRFLDAMAALGPQQRTLTGIAASLGRSASSLATTARRLDLDHGFITRGNRYSFAHRTIDELLNGRWP